MVDVNKFGSFIGVPNAPSLLADYIYGVGFRALNGEDLIPGYERDPIETPR